MEMNLDLLLKACRPCKVAHIGNEQSQGEEDDGDLIKVCIKKCYMSTHIGDEQPQGKEDDGDLRPRPIFCEHVVQVEHAKHGLPQREERAPKVPVWCAKQCSGCLERMLR